MYAEQLPPHDAEAEEAVIGSLLIDGKAISAIAAFLKAEHFYHERNRVCYEACTALYSRGDAIDQVTVRTQLAAMGKLDEAHGAAYLSHLVNIVPTSTHIEHYARIVEQKARQRGLITAAGAIAQLGYADTDDVEGAITKAEGLLYKLHGERRRGARLVREIIDDYLEETSSLDMPEHAEHPIPTGFADLDNALGQMRRGALFVLAARPSIGKSALALNIAHHAASAGFRAMYFSLEMSGNELAMRMLSSIAQVDHHLLTLGLLGELDYNRVMDATGAISDVPLYVDDSPTQTPLTVRSEAYRIHLQDPLDLIIVDYLQRMRLPGAQGREQEISGIARELKTLAQDLNVPVLALAQLSRAIEQRPEHRPVLSDLRESGAIEQEADVAIFIHREDKFTTEEQWAQKNPDTPYPENLTELLILKNRHGPTRAVNLYARMVFSRFENLASQAQMEGM